MIFRINLQKKKRLRNRFNKKLSAIKKDHLCPAGYFFSLGSVSDLEQCIKYRYKIIIRMKYIFFCLGSILSRGA